MNGSYTPQTLPVGGEEAREVSPRSLAEALLVKNASNMFMCFISSLTCGSGRSIDNNIQLFSTVSTVFLQCQPGEL